MPANFPTTPTLNQTYTYAGVTWSWTGNRWQVQSPGAIGGGGGGGSGNQNGTYTNYYAGTGGLNAYNPGSAGGGSNTGGPAGANTGSGGGGGGYPNTAAGTGGSGIVIIRYLYP